MEIDVQDIDHLGLIAGIVDEIGIVAIINCLLGTHPLEEISAGHINEENLKALGETPWISRVPATIAEAQQLMQTLPSEMFTVTAEGNYVRSRSL